MMRALGILFATLLLSACRLGGDPSGVVVSFSTYASTPVVVTEFSLNGTNLGLLPIVAVGLADQDHPRLAGTGEMSVGYPKGGSTLRLEAEWVELLTDRAWRAQVDVAVDTLETIPTDRVRLMPIFGPNGLMIVASDPVPTSQSDTRENDVARICGTRHETGDTDFAAKPREYPGLFEALERSYPPQGTSNCSTNGS